MFARYYLELALPCRDVEQALLRDPRGWLPGLARDAEARSATLLAEVGFGTDGRRVAKEVRVTVRDPIRVQTKTLLPVSWEATGPRSLFPELEADIEVAPLGEARTQLSVNARYRPPFGVVGRAMDRALLHRVAEATLKDFLDRVAEQLAERAGAVADGPA